MYLLHGVSYSFLKCIFNKLIFSNRQANSLWSRVTDCWCEMSVGRTLERTLVVQGFWNNNFTSVLHFSCKVFETNILHLFSSVVPAFWKINFLHLFYIYGTLFVQGFWESYLTSYTYTCRARVPQTGELEERDIRLDVQVIIMVVTVRMISWLPWDC